MTASLQTDTTHIAVSRPRASRLPLVGLAVALAALFAAAAILDGPERVFAGDDWRGALAPPLTLLGLLIAGPWLGRSHKALVTRFRTLASVDDATYAATVSRVPLPRRRRLVLALVIGVLFGAILSQGAPLRADLVWTGLLAVAGNVASAIVLVSIALDAYAATQVYAALLDLPLALDVFALDRMDVFGQQAVRVALVFPAFAAIRLALRPGPGELLLMGLPIAVAIGLVMVSLFFLTLWHPHAVMAQLRHRELAAVRDELSRLSTELAAGLSAGRANDMSALAAVVTARIAYERRVLDTSEWPFDLETLRNLAVSASLPTAAMLARGYLFR